METTSTTPETPRARSTECSVLTVIGLIGGKWKLYVIRVLISDGPQRFNRLLETIDGISPKVLTENLRELEASGIVARADDRGAQRYAVTDSGQELMPALHMLGEWATAHAKNAPG